MNYVKPQWFNSQNSIPGNTFLGSLEQSFCFCFCFTVALFSVQNLEANPTEQQPPYVVFSNQPSTKVMEKLCSPRPIIVGLQIPSVLASMAIMLRDYGSSLIYKYFTSLPAPQLRYKFV